MSRTTDSEELTLWDQLSNERQVELWAEYGRYPDSSPPTCSLETKIERFRHWLKERGIYYEG